MSRTGANLFFTGAAAAALALTAAPALAQDEGEAAAEEAVPPGKTYSLGVAVSDDVRGQMASGGAGLEALTAGISADASEAMRVYFVAARYDDDRLVRYDVSEPIALDEGGDYSAQLSEAITHALGPRTESGVAAAPIEESVAAEMAPVSGSSFVGSMPANTLMGMIDPEAEPLDFEARNMLDSVGLLAFVPAAEADRNSENGAITAFVVRLNYED